MQFSVTKVVAVAVAMLAAVLFGGAEAKNNPCHEWHPPREVTRFRRCYYGCPRVERGPCSYYVLPDAISCSLSSIMTVVSMVHTTGVTPITTVQTCSACTQTVNPIGCTSLVVCNPVQTSCAASYANFGSTLSFSTSSGTTTVGTSQSAGAVSLSGSNGSVAVLLALGAIAVMYAFA